MAEEQIQTTEETTQAEDVSRETLDVPAPTRPEYVPEKFWNDETGEVKTEDLAKSYVNLEKFSTGKKEEMKEQLLTELQTEAEEGLPEDPAGYKLPSLVEGITEEMVEQNPLTDWWRNHCHELGLPEEVFQSGVNNYTDILMQNQPDLDAEAEKLGENASERIEAVNAWASSQFPPEEFEAIQMIGSSAIGISALERIMDMQKSSMGRSSEVAKPAQELTIDTVKEMMKDKRYFDPRHRDSSYVKQVDDAWARLNMAGKV
tara:strand:- start:12292 stop:13071 length:780 start_codon:yes stop_codon:yes gene_type:complete